MKYIARVKTNRNGAILILFAKIWFFKFPIEWYGRYIDLDIGFLIDEDIAKWKKYYGDKLTIIDDRITDKKKG